MQGLARALEVDPSTLYRWRTQGEDKVTKLALSQLAETEQPIVYRNDGPLVTYVIRAGETVKIGKTRDAQARLAMLQVGNPLALHLLGTTLEPEYMVHQRFAEHRIRGEWFRAAPDVLAFAASLASHVPSAYSAG